MDVRQFLTELKSRGVYRVAAIYAASSWGFLQIADVVFPILGLPEWAITAVLASAALGFPLALLLAWLFDITPLGVVETDAHRTRAAAVKPTLSPARLIELALILLLVFLVGFLYFDRLAPKMPTAGIATSSASERPSVAVLPFVNISGSVDVDYFGDGLAEETLNLLARLDELDVAARTSSFYFKGKAVDAREIGQRLGVSHLLAGSVRLADKQVRVTAQLVQVADGYQLWSQTFDRDFKDIFRIQEDIARSVTSNLQILLSKSSKAILEQSPTEQADAYDYYLRGLDYLRRSLGEKSSQQALNLFEKALALDSSYAAAFAGSCNAHLQLYRAGLSGERFAAATQACERALELDPRALEVYVALGNLSLASGRSEAAREQFESALSLRPRAVDALIGLANSYAQQNQPDLAEAALRRAIDGQRFDSRAYLALGNFYFNEGRVAEALPHYERITSLTPDSAQAFNNLGAAYALLNRFEEAITASMRSLELAPSAYAYSNVGSSLFFLGRFEEAAKMYLESTEFAPEDFENWGNLGDAYRYGAKDKGLAKAMYAKAIVLAEARLRVNAEDPITLSMLAQYHAKLGDREAALTYLDRARALAPADMYVEYFAAVAMTSLGEKDAALSALTKSVELGYSRDLVRVDPGVQSLRDLLGYGALVRE